MTPINSGPTANNEMQHPTTPATHNTPALLEDSINNEMENFNNELSSEQSYLHQQVLSAAQETAQTNSGPTFEWEVKHNLFALCGAAPKPAPKKVKLGSDGKPLPPKNKKIEKISKMLKNKPELLTARSANMNSLGLPDGFTVLHAACRVGNEEVVNYLLNNHVMSEGQEVEHGEAVQECKLKGDGGKDLPMLDLNVRDMQGRTALHLAAENGHMEVIGLLRKSYDRFAKMMEERVQKLLEDSSSDDDDDENEGLAETMAKLSTSETPNNNSNNTNTSKSKPLSTPKTPKSRSPMRRRKTPKSSRSPMPPHSRSPMPPHSRSPLLQRRFSPKKSPTFSGPSAPIDLSGRTPLGYAATSPAPKAKKNRAGMEKLLYEEGDRSIMGSGHTPPKARCGPRGRFLSPNRGMPGSGRKMVAFNGEDSNGVDSVVVTGGATSYLSPTPRKNGRYSNTPGSVTSSNFATPFSSPPTILEEEEEPAGNNNDGKKKENALQLQWGASEMNGWRIDMEDAILVKYEFYGEGDRLPPKPSTLTETSSGASLTIPTMGLFCVCDGHGDGGAASNFIATNLERKLKSQPEWSLAYHSCNTSYEPLVSAFTQACYDLDEDLRKDVTKPRDGGTTAIIALVSDDYLFVANVGDSRCIFVKKRKDETKEEEADAGTEANSKPCWAPSTIKVIPMSEDHKPDLPEERARIESAGLTVQTDHVPPDENDENGEFTTVHRVKKSDKELLGVARAFGDYDYKSNADLSASRQAVVCTPDIVVRKRTDSEDMYLVLACDGIWDVMSNDEVGAFVARRVAELLGCMDNAASDDAEKSEETAAASNLCHNTVQGEVLARVGDDLLKECLRKGSRDNMSVLIVALPGSGLSTTGVVLGSSTSALPAVVSTNKEGAGGVVPGADDTVRALAY
ncbi:hypothetical protein ACHAXR_004652 [Thalassiosira sp. AJA248-18]